MKHIQAASSSISRLSYKLASSYGEAAARAKFEGAQFLLDELHEVCGRKFRIMDTSQENSRGGSRARDHEIIKASIIGIVGNMLLVAFKLVIGFFSHSIAIILDGVNNATDALSSIITIVGTKLAARRPDRHHPFGYGRIEYLTSVVIAIIILVAGFLSLRESIQKIIDPGHPSYSAITITIIIVAIIAKVFLGICFNHYGKKTKSEALIASGIDSNYDAVLSAGTLVVAFAQNIWNLNIDGIVGLIISFVVLKAGFEVLRDALGPIIGLPESKKLVDSIVSYASSFSPVEGVHDVIMDDFDPNKVIGSMRIEVPDDMEAWRIHELTREISSGIAEKFGISMTIGIYATNRAGMFANMRASLDRIVNENANIRQVHGFYCDAQNKICYFDLVIAFNVNGESIKASVVDALKKAYPAYSFDVEIDRSLED